MKHLAIGMLLCACLGIVYSVAMMSPHGVIEPHPTGEDPASRVLGAAAGAIPPATSAESSDGDHVARYPVQRDSSTIRIGEVDYNQLWDGDMRTVTYMDGGVFMRGRFRDGKQDGVHEAWRLDGTKISIITWDYGVRSGRAVYYGASGSVLSSGSYSRGYMDGLWDVLYESGSRESSGKYIVGLSNDGSPREQLRVGEWVFWLPDGSVDLERSGFYDADKRVRGL